MKNGPRDPSSGIRIVRVEEIFTTTGIAACTTCVHSKPVHLGELAVLTLAGGAAALSGGLIGPPGTAWPDAGRLDGVPVFLGCSDIDAHIPKERVIESAAVFRARGADVTAILYPGMDHTVNDDELAHVRALVKRVAEGAHP